MPQARRDTFRMTQLLNLVVLTCCGAACTVVGNAWADQPTAGGSATESVDLTAAETLPPALVKVVFEVNGQLISKPENSEQESPQHELKAMGNFLYEEQLLDEATRQAVRYYQQAESEISVDRRPHTIQLREDRQYVMLEPAQPTVALRSLQGPLTRAELELIEVPGGSHLVDQLLPGRSTKIGETWTHDDDLLARLVNLDSVSVNEVSSKLVGIQDQVAKIELAGKLMGSVAGVLTELDLKAKYSFDLQRHRVTWLALGIGESRTAGLMQPGLRVQARVRMLLQAGVVPHVDQQSLQPLLANQDVRGDLLEYQPDSGRFSLTHDRRWHLFSEKPNLTVMRLIEDDQLVAQCNLRALPALPVGQEVSLAQFQKEIRKALGSAAQQVVDAQESTLPNGLRQLRVAIVGRVANTPIHWIYYQLNDTEQRRLTCAFTMSGEAVSRFGAEDLSIVGSLRLLDGADQTAEVASRASQ